MRRLSRPFTALLLLVPIGFAASMPAAQAIHWYRGPGGGCAPLDGALGAQPSPNTVVHTVEVGHNTFRDTITGFSFDGPAETTIKAGEAVRWTWNSAHCHSVDARSGAGFYSGYYYPATAPESPNVADAVFAYPVLDDTPTLSYTLVFSTPGTYDYVCEHHASIGMTGRVIVTE